MKRQTLRALAKSRGATGALREEADVLADEVARLRERVGELEAALVHISIQDGEELTPLDNCDAHTLADALRHCGEVARAALKGTR